MMYAAPFKVIFYFFSSRRRHTRFDCDWSSDVCSSDLEMGIDFMLCYPSAVLGLLDIEDGEVAGAVAHAANRWLVSIFEPYKHRMAVGGIIPMNNPQVASAAVEHAASIGMKTTIMASYVRRYLGDKPASGPQAHRLDTYGIDSAYDYDPLWAKFVDAGIAPLVHG